MGDEHSMNNANDMNNMNDEAAMNGEPVADGEESAKDKRKPTKRYAENSIIDVIKVLWEETDDRHGLSADAIRRRLLERHQGDETYKAPVRNAIEHQAEWLSEYGSLLGREVRRVDVEEARSAGVADVREGWYMTPLLSRSEMRLLKDGLMLSRIDEEELAALFDSIDHIAGGSWYAEQLKKGPVSTRVDSYEHINRQLLYTIERLDDAIARKRCVSFEYCNYDASGELTPRKNRDGKPRTYWLDPYCMVYKQGAYFLIGHFHDAPVPTNPTQDENGTNLRCFVMDRIRNVEVHEKAKDAPDDQDDMAIRVPMNTWDLNGLPIATDRQQAEDPFNPGLQAFNPARFARMRPKLSMGTLQRTRMRIHPDKLTEIYESFDLAKIEPDPDLHTQDGRPYYIVTVYAPEHGMVWWALEHCEDDRLTVLEPAAVRDRLRRAGMKLALRYGQPPEETQD